MSKLYEGLERGENHIPIEVATQNNKGNPIKDANFDTGAVRSADVDHLDFASMPLMGLLGVLAVAGNGGIKYGRHNYSKGIPVHVTINHMAVHLIKYILGDRTEDHMSKVAWGAMVVNETQAKNPELSAPHMLGPGATLTEPMIAEMDRSKPERDRRRQAGEFEDLFDGTFADMPEVKAILAQRKKGRTRWTNTLRVGLAKELRDRLKNPPRFLVNLDGSPRFNGPAENGFRKPEPVVDPEAAKAHASELMENMRAFGFNQGFMNSYTPAHDSQNLKSDNPAKSTPDGYFPKPQLRCAADARAATYKAVVQALDEGKITCEDFNRWRDGGPIPACVAYPPARTESHVPVKQHKSGGNPESFDYYDPNTGSTKTKLDHMGGCPPLP